MLSIEFVDDFEQILTVLIFEHRLGKFGQPLFGNPSLAIGDTFQAADFQTLTLFEHLNVDRFFGQRIVRARVQPGESAG